MSKKKSILPFDAIFFTGLYIIMILRYFMQGIQYYTYTDDNNQYGVYFRRAMNGSIWNDIILHYRRYFERPLAFFTDAYIWQNFFQNMHLLLIIITTMYFFICFLLYKTFNKLSINFGILGVVFLALIPCGYEGAYWISASSRIVVSMFFAMLSVWLYFGGITKIDRKVLIALSAVSNLLSYLFYEQTAVFSFVLFFICALAYSLNSKPSRKSSGAREKLKTFIMPMFIPVVNLLITAIYYLYFMFFSEEGLSESRNKIITTGLTEKIVHTTKELINLIKETMLDFNLTAIKEGFKQPVGIAMIFTVILLAAFMFVTFSMEKEKDAAKSFKPYALKFFAGLLLSFAPLFLFYLLQNVYFQPRMLFPSFVGFAILIDLFFDIFTAFYKPLNTLKRATAAILIIPFFMASAYITGVYKTTNEIDKEIASSFLKTYNANYSETTDKVYILNPIYSYTGFKTPPLGNITAADWIMLGNLNANQYEHYFRKITFIPANGEFDISLFSDNTALIFGIDENHAMHNLFLENDTLITSSGEIFGKIADGVFVR